ncbi:MAG: DNA translocase FtsK, partial [Oligoflexia bacterium]|nr:DNA translocase FtsK [Oligoflexia bacterium]
MLLGILACVYVVAALSTYSPLDPSFTRASGSTVSNAAGPMGAWVADFGYQLLGYGAWSVVPVAVALSLVLARRSIGGLGALA